MLWAFLVNFFWKLILKTQFEILEGHGVKKGTDVKVIKVTSDNIKYKTYKKTNNFVERLHDIYLIFCFLCSGFFWQSFFLHTKMHQNISSWSLNNKPGNFLLSKFYKISQMSLWRKINPTHTCSMQTRKTPKSIVLNQIVFIDSLSQFRHVF